MSNDMEYNHESLSLFGLESFRKAATELMLGRNCNRISAGHVLTVQSVSVINAFRLICQILKSNLRYKEIHVPQQSLEQFDDIMRATGFAEPKRYRYYNPQKHRLDIEGMLEDLRMMPLHTAVLFQVCCHDPTGCDPTNKEWIRIAEVVAGRLFPIMDLSYQGIATGDPKEDSFPVRLFARLGIEMAICVSFSQNFLLYGDRVGAATFVLRYKEDLIPLKSHLGTLIHSMYGSPPYHGAQIVATILNNQCFYSEWEKSLKTMVSNMNTARAEFARVLTENVPGNWDHVKYGRGPYAVSNLTERQIQHLILYHHVYVSLNGRLNVCGLDRYNMQYVTEAFANCIKEYPDIEDKEEIKYL